MATVKKNSAPALIGKTRAIAKSQPKRRRKKPSVAKKITKRRTKRRIGGISSELPKALEIIVTAAAGGFAARMIQKVGMLAPKSSTSPDYRPYVGIAVGVVGMVMSKNAMIKSAGLGCATVSAMGLIPEKDIPVIGAVRMIGANKPHVISLQKKRIMGSRPRMIAGSNSTSALIGASKGIYAGGIGG